MSLKTILVTIEEHAIAELRHIGGIIEQVVISIGQKLVAEVKDSDLGTRAMNLISDLASKEMDGKAKMAKLLDDITGDLQALHAAGGLKGLETSIENFAKEFGQSAYNDFVAATKKL
jgi:hypothetical protein